MFLSCFRSYFSIQGKTKFEKVFLRSIYPGDTLPPYEEDLQHLSDVLKGKDPEVNPLQAFNQIISNIESFDPQKQKWMMIVKLLLIINHCVEEGIQLDVIKQLDANCLLNTSFPDKKVKQQQITDFIQIYPFVIRKKAYLYSQPVCLLKGSENKSARKQLIQNLEIDVLIQKLNEIQEFQQLLFQLIATSEAGYLVYEIFTYTFIHVLHDQIAAYSAQLQGLQQIFVQLPKLSFYQI